MEIQLNALWFGKKSCENYAHLLHKQLYSTVLI